MDAVTSHASDPTWGFVALMRRVLQGYGALWSIHVSPELTSPQFGVLAALNREPGLDQRTLGERLSIDRSTTADVVSRLAGRNLIERSRDVRDARRNTLVLTAEGRRRLEETSVAVEQLRQRVFAGLAEVDQVEFIILLEKVIVSIDSVRQLEGPTRLAKAP
ncbi:MAG: MarR family winged helix-turn-helix transcriptional regulator [Acidimicrobiales bacterium]